jgi:hypothetical protein
MIRRLPVSVKHASLDRNPLDLVEADLNGRGVVEHRGTVVSDQWAVISAEETPTADRRPLTRYATDHA